MGPWWTELEAGAATAQPLMIALGVIVFGVVGYRAASAYHL